MHRGAVPAAGAGCAATAPVLRCKHHHPEALRWRPSRPSVQPLTILPARRLFRKAVLLKRQVAAFTRPRLAFLLLHKRPSGGWQKGGSVYCTFKPLQRATGPPCQTLGTAKPVNT